MQKIAEEITELINICKQYCVNDIVISTIFTKNSKNLTTLIRKLNKRLNVLCKDSDFLTCHKIKLLGTAVIIILHWKSHIKLSIKHSHYNSNIDRQYVSKKQWS